MIPDISSAILPSFIDDGASRLIDRRTPVVIATEDDDEEDLALLLFSNEQTLEKAEYSLRYSVSFASTSSSTMQPSLPPSILKGSLSSSYMDSLNPSSHTASSSTRTTSEIADSFIHTSTTPLMTDPIRPPSSIVSFHSVTLREKTPIDQEDPRRVLGSRIRLDEHESLSTASSAASSSSLIHTSRSIPQDQCCKERKGIPPCHGKAGLKPILESSDEQPSQCFKNIRRARRFTSWLSNVWKVNRVVDTGEDTSSTSATKKPMKKKMKKKEIIDPLSLEMRHDIPL